MNRREFLQAGTALVASVAVPAGVPEAGAVADVAGPVDWTSRYIHETYALGFQVSDGYLAALASSIQATKELTTANVLNRAFA